MKVNHNETRPQPEDRGSLVLVCTDTSRCGEPPPSQRCHSDTSVGIQTSNKARTAEMPCTDPNARLATCPAGGLTHDCHLMLTPCPHCTLPTKHPLLHPKSAPLGWAQDEDPPSAPMHCSVPPHTLPSLTLTSFHDFQLSPQTGPIPQHPPPIITCVPSLLCANTKTLHHTHLKAPLQPNAAAKSVTQHLLPSPAAPCPFPPLQAACTG